MAIALQNTIQNASRRFKSGPAGQFFRWWGEELSKALPARVRARVQYARRRLLMQIDNDEIALRVDVQGDESETNIQFLDSFAVDQDVQLQQQQIRDVLLHNELSEVNRDLLLPESDILKTPVVMPLAAEANLRQALAYEMDRHTPFRAEEVFYSWSVTGRDRETGQLHFDLFVTPRKPVEDSIEKLRRFGLAPSGVDVAGPQGPVGINLLPHGLRHRLVNQRARVNWIIGAVSVVLLIIVMAQSLWLREYQIRAVEAAIDDVRAEAMVVRQIKKQIEDANEAAGFLQSRRSQSGSKLEILAELTTILPQDTFLDRLSTPAGMIQIQGKSENAQSLIELINNSPMFEGASFRGPTRLDTRSNKEIFDLNAKVSQQETTQGRHTDAVDP